MYRGVYTALVTPFNTDKSVDEGALRALVDFQMDGGVTGIVPMGTTGESPTVTHDENIDVIRIVVDQVAGRAEVIAGTGSNSTAEAVRMTRLAAEVGATATLQVTPYYNKPTQEGLYAHFTTIADATDLRMVVYNIPGRSACNIETDTMIRLADHPRIAALKEASGNMAQVMDVCDRKPAGFDVLSGDDNLTLPILALGGVGVVSVASNIAPKLMGELVTAGLAQDYQRARELHYRLLPLFRGIFLQSNPIPVKHMLAAMGMIGEIYRLPLTPLNEADAAAVDAIVKKVRPE
ncbi:MAG: 4-hydroxy-tetrahydrodipicolinate synthase [Spirochaetales bacterium]|nr:4-hydroxy-tetrahydrodipicolinate synthase [Spirochaetales bacterium]